MHYKFHCNIYSGVEVEEVKSVIKDYVSNGVFHAWIAPNRFLNNSGQIVMVCKNKLTRDVIKNRYYSEICDALNEKIELIIEGV